MSQNNDENEPQLSNADEFPILSERSLRRTIMADGLDDSWVTQKQDGSLSQPHSIDYWFSKASSDTRSVLLMHASKVGESNPPWIRLSLKTRMGRRERERLRKGKLPAFGIFRQLIVLLIIVGTIAFIIQFESLKEATEAPPPPPPTLLELLKSGEKPSAEPGGELALPSLSLIASQSATTFFLNNIGSSEWPSVRITLNNDDGHWLQWDEPVQPGETLRVAFDKFKLDGESFDSQKTPLRRIWVEVPGFRTFTRNF